ncbi:MAG TPA: hypothetical protein VE994_13390 [Terriglobales bacterium]|nr:hypothetical protein [Terriglobales bacterium]
MTSSRLFAVASSVILFVTIASASPHECPYSSVDPRVESAKLQADFDVHRTAIEARVALGQLRVAEKVAVRLYKQHLLTSDEYGARMKEIAQQEHAVRVHMLKAKIAAFKSVLDVSSNDVESLGKIHRLRADLEAEERTGSNSCTQNTRSVVD